MYGEAVHAGTEEAMLSRRPVKRSGYLMSYEISNPVGSVKPGGAKMTIPL